MAREKARAELPGREWIDGYDEWYRIGETSQNEWSAAMEQLYHSDGFSVGKLIRPKRD
ncbi:MAG TPA: hypothetical protein VF089_06290 [Candidatus Binatia bacterium]